MTNQILTEIRSLIDGAATVYVASIDDEGVPNVKAMFPCPRDGYGVHYFSTNVSSRRCTQFMANPTASLYFCDPQQINGLLLRGAMEVLTDPETKARFWNEGDELYYPGGVTDPDYCIYRFTARDGRYYHGFQSVDFEIEELA